MKRLIMSLVAGAAVAFAGAAQAASEMVGGYTWEYELVNGKTAKILGVDSFVPGALTIPAKLGGKNVTEIGPEVFKERTFTTVTIPSTVTEIYERAFYGCVRLRAVKIPDAVTSIGASAFEQCTALRCVDFGKKVSDIGASAFSGCTYLAALVFRGKEPYAFPQAFSGVGGEVYVAQSAAKNWSVTQGDTWYGLPVTIGDMTVYVSATSSDVNCGTVSGGDANFAVGKKVTLKAKAAKGCVFGGWTEYGSKEVFSYSASLAYTVDGYYLPNEPLFTARFKKVDNPSEDDPLFMELPWKTTAWNGYLDMDMRGCVSSFSEPKFKFKGLPSGIKYDANTFKFTGQATKPGPYTVEVTASNASKESRSDSFLVVVPNFYDEEVNIDDSYGPFIPGDPVNVDMAGAEGCKVTGLPPGLKWTSKDIDDKTCGEVLANSVYGVATKPGSYTVYCTKTDANRVKHTSTTTFVIDPFPELTVATFGTGTGTASGGGGYPANKMVSLKAKADSGCVFSGWYISDSGDEEDLISRSANYSYEMGTSDETVYARFITADEDAEGIKTTIWANWIEEPLEEGVTSQFELRCGVWVRWPLEVEAHSDTAVKVTGLPAGLKYTAKPIVDKTFGPIEANTIYGYPTAPSKWVKNGELIVQTPSAVKLSVTTAGKTKIDYNLELFVRSREEWSVGNYSGGNGNGLATISITEAGKLTGKWLQYNGTYTLSSPGFYYYDEKAKTYYFDIAVKNSDVPIPALLMEGGVIVFDNGTNADLYRNMDWKSEKWKPIATKFAKSEAKYSDGDFDFTFKFAATGAVTVKCVYTETNGSASGTATLIPSCDPEVGSGAFDGFFHVGLQAKAKKFPGYFDRFFVHWDGEAFTVTGVGD